MGVETVTNTDAELTLNSAFNTTNNKTTVRQVKPNYLGIAVVSGVTAWAGYKGGELLADTLSETLNISPDLIAIPLAEIGAAYTAKSENSNIDPNHKSLIGPS